MDNKVWVECCFECATAFEINGKVEKIGEGITAKSSTPFIYLTIQNENKGYNFIHLEKFDALGVRCLKERHE